MRYSFALMHFNAFNAFKQTPQPLDAVRSLHYTELRTGSVNRSRMPPGKEREVPTVDQQRYTDQTRQTERADEREKLRPCLRQYLEGRGIDTSKNFRCLNPDHPDRHPSAYYTTGHRVLCRSCGAKYDIFDLVAMDLGRSAADRAVFDEVRRRYGQGQDFSFSPAAARPQPRNDTPQTAPPEPEQPEDYSDFFSECAARISSTDYPQRRGLTEDTCKRFGLGYAPQWHHPNSKIHTPRLIIPTSRSSYTARDTRETIPEYQQPYKNQKVGRSNLYLQHNLFRSEAACVIVEGELDALSVMQCGGSACALRSVTNAGQLLRLLESQKPAVPLFLLLDADDAGQKAQKELADGLRRLQIPFACNGARGYGIPDGCKDANDMLLQCPDKLNALVEILKL